MAEEVVLAVLVFFAAIIYSSVGHAGASGYLAAMALVGMAPDSMKPTALVLNILVATVATVRFARAGWFSWRILLPFVVASAPFAFLGGYLQAPDRIYKILVGIALLVAAARLSWRPPVHERDAEHLPIVPAVVIGAGIGFLSGLTGVGGGIYLSPILLLLAWASPRTTAAVSAAFILVNSAFGLAGHLGSLQEVPAAILWLGPFALTGSVIGTSLGTKKYANITLRRVLAVVLVIAAAKMIYG